MMQRRGGEAQVCQCKIFRALPLGRIYREQAQFRLNSLHWSSPNGKLFDMEHFAKTNYAHPTLSIGKLSAFCISLETHQMLSPVSKCPGCSVATQALTLPLRPRENCKVVSYCSKEHQVADQDNHREHCKDLKKAYYEVPIDEINLRQCRTPPFEGDIGELWDENPSFFVYLCARSRAIAALIQDSKLMDCAIDMVHEYAVETVHLDRKDCVGLRAIVPWLKLYLWEEIKTVTTFASGTV